MTQPLMEACKESLHTDLSPLAACLVLGVDLAGTMDGLGWFWREHQAPLKMLSPDELAAVVKVKDRQKVALEV
jgi:hypothetical protein